MIRKAVLTAYLQSLSTCCYSIYWQRPAPHVLVLIGCRSDSSTISRPGNMFLRPGTIAVTFKKVPGKQICATCSRNLLSHIQILHIQRSGSEMVGGGGGLSSSIV